MSIKMKHEQYLHELRVKFIELNMAYTDKIREGVPVADLKGLNDEVNAILTEIKLLEQNT
jgi:hypothetical protein